MQLPAAIDLIEHRALPPVENSRYLLGRLAAHWRSWGVHVGRAADPPPAETAPLAFLHVDATRVDPVHGQLADRYRACVNGRVRDISKSRFSTNRLARGSSWRGPVIVKTDANFGGQMDAVLARRSGARAAPPGGLRPWHAVETLDPRNYPVFRSLAAVPAAVWRNPRLIVEKLRCERDAAGRYCLRVWYFLGDRELGELDYATAPVAKGASIVAREPLTDVPEALRALRRRLGFDYGKFDYALVGGEPVVYDVNTTPIVGRTNVEVLGGEAGIARLAAGLAAWSEAAGGSGRAGLDRVGSAE